MDALSCIDAINTKGARPEKKHSTFRRCAKAHHISTGESIRRATSAAAVCALPRFLPPVGIILVRVEHHARDATHRVRRMDQKLEKGSNAMAIRTFLTGLAVGAVVTSFLSQWPLSAADKVTDHPKCISPAAVADYLHSVIRADRTFYTTEIVERMQVRGIVVASENWRATAKLPLPAQFLMEAGRLISQEGSGLRFRLISNWAINKTNRPASDFEKTGLTEILANPDSPYTAVTTQDGKAVFQAIYADKAVSQSCVGCHNAHPDSPRRDFKPRDVIGGLVLTVPLYR
jgi:hypothetical protein